MLMPICSDLVSQHSDISETCSSQHKYRLETDDVLWCSPVNITVWSSNPEAKDPVKVTLHQPGVIPSADGAVSSTPLLSADGTSNNKFQFQLPSPKLWSPTTPNLYYFTIELGKDVVTSYLGFRSIEKRVDSNGIVRPFLNGEFIFQFGPLDQGFWPDGTQPIHLLLLVLMSHVSFYPTGLYTPPTVEAMESDIKLIKSLGFNLVRKHVKIEPDLYYYACDRLGLMVWQVSTLSTSVFLNHTVWAADGRVYHIRKFTNTGYAVSEPISISFNRTKCWIRETALSNGIFPHQFSIHHHLGHLQVRPSTRSPLSLSLSSLQKVHVFFSFFLFFAFLWPLFIARDGVNLRVDLRFNSLQRFVKKTHIV